MCCGGVQHIHTPGAALDATLCRRYLLHMSDLYKLNDAPVLSPSEPQSMADYAGQVLLVYNAAAL